MGDPGSEQRTDISFCERCGYRLGTRGRADYATACESCGCFVCSSCLASAGECQGCAEKVGGLAAVRRVRRHARSALTDIAAPSATRRSAVAVGGVLLVGVIVAMATGGPAMPPSGGVAGATGRPEATASPAAAANRSNLPGASGPAASGRSGSAPAPSSGAGSAEVTVATVRSWPSGGGGTSLEILVGVRNAGSGQLALDPEASRYVVGDATGTSVATGRFTAALPEELGPGEIGFLVATDATALVTASARLTVRPEVATSPAPGAAPRLRARASAPVFEGGRLSVPARITNTGSSTVSNVVVGAVLLDRHDTPVAALFGLSDVGPLRPGQAANVTLTYPPVGPVKADAVERVIACAYELE